VEAVTQSWTPYVQIGLRMVLCRSSLYQYILVRVSRSFRLVKMYVARLVSYLGVARGI
jgi:hypothetical protein